MKKNMYIVNVYVIGHNVIDKSNIIKNISQTMFSYASKTITKKYYTVLFHEITPHDSTIDVGMFINDPYILNIAIIYYNENIESKMNIPSWINKLCNFQIDTNSIIKTYLISNDSENTLKSYAENQSIEHLDNNEICDKVRSDMDTFASKLYGKYYLRYYFDNYCTYL